MIYFIRAVGTDRVKIGVSGDVGKRFRNLEMMSPVPLALERVIEGDAMDERQFHLDFKIRRRHGEWFDMTPDEVQSLTLSGHLSNGVTRSGKPTQRRNTGTARDSEGVYEFRERLGMNQKEFAEYVGTRQATVSAWETGTAIPNPMAKKLLTLLKEREKEQEEPS